MGFLDEMQIIITFGFILFLLRKVWSYPMLRSCPIFSPRRFRTFALTLRSMTPLKLVFSILCGVRLKVHFFSYAYTVIPGPYTEKTTISFH